MKPPSYYGFKTLKTGNKPHKPTTPDQRDRAKKYGLAHGYFGSEGGWIYDKNSQHVAHGWGQFWHRFGQLIREWEK